MVILMIKKVLIFLISLSCPLVGNAVVLNTNLIIPAGNAYVNAGLLNLNGYAVVLGAASSLTTTGPILANGPIYSSGGVYNLAVNNNGLLIVSNGVSGYNNLAVAVGGTLSLNNRGNLSNALALNGGTLNLNGGTYRGNVTGVNGIVNVNSLFTPPGSINAGTININDGGKLNSTRNVSANIWNINKGGILCANSNIPGSLNLNSGGTYTPIQSGLNVINGNYLQAGTLNITLIDAEGSKYTQLQVTGNTTLNGGTINVALPDKGANIADKEVFDIISSGTLTSNALPTVYSPSFLLSFKPVVKDNVLGLVASRKALTSVHTNSTLNGVSGALDGIQNSGNSAGLSKILTALNGQTSQAGIEQILLTLVPDEALTPLIDSHETIFRLSLEEVFKRMNLLRVGANPFKTDYVAGDMSDNKNSYGPFIIGNTTKQKPRDGISGFTATTGGFGLLVDTPVVEDTHIGVAASYAGTNVRRDDKTGNNTMINNVQGILYGSTEYGPLFADGALSYGVNRYRGKRNIPAINETAIGTYSSIQYGGKIRGGFSVSWGNLEFSPLATLQYVHLNRGSYVETGAPGANLSVKSRQVNDMQVGLGGRLADIGQVEEFFPEIHILYIVDTRRPNLQVTSQFIDGGPAFVTAGPLPPKSGVNAGLSITAMLSDQLLFTGSYDLLAKKSLISNSASIKFRWLF